MIPKLVAVVVAGIVVAGTSVWFLSKDGRYWSERDFDSCAIQGAQLVLAYGYGAGDDIRTTVKKREGPFEVRLEAHTSDGPVPAILLHGETRLDGWSVGKDVTVLQHDGKRLNCKVIAEQ